MAAAKPLKGVSGTPTEMAAGDLIPPDNVAARYFFPFAGMEPAGTGWSVTGSAPSSEDSVTTGIPVVRFDDTAGEGRGALFYIPAGVSTLRLRLWVRAQSAPGATRYIRPKFHYRGVPSGSALDSWASHDLGDQSIPANAYWQYLTISFALTDPSTDLVADRLYQFEMTFHDSTTGTKLTGDRTALACVMELY